MTVFFLTLLLLAQSPAFDVQITGENEFALADGEVKAWTEAASRLRGLPEAKAIPFKPSELEALLAATMPLPKTAAPTQSVHIDPVVVLARVNKVRKDQEAALGIVGAWKQMQESLQKMKAANATAQEKQMAATQFRVTRLAAQVAAALAKTEESMGSSRVASEQERTRAKQLANDALALGPNLPDAHYAMGDVLLDAGDVEPAITEYRKALAMNPNSSSGHAKLANALREDGEVLQATAEIKEALRLDPNSPVSHTDLGLFLSAECRKYKRGRWLAPLTDQGKISVAVWVLCKLAGVATSTARVHTDSRPGGQRSQRGEFKGEMFIGESRCAFQAENSSRQVESVLDVCGATTGGAVVECADPQLDRRG
jgi:tetratricopeptide (TPR) repeat protein